MPGFSVEVKSHRNSSGVSFELWQAMPQPIAPGDTFSVSAGCDKRFAPVTTASIRRQLPRLPAHSGNDFVVRYPVQGEPGNDGSS